MRKAAWYFDSVALSNFALAGRLDLLLKRYPGGRLCVTTQVADELANGVHAGYGILNDILQALDRGEMVSVTLTRSETRRYQSLLATLGSGEASTIAVAGSRRGVVVTDDRHARAICRENKIAVTGTLGILKAVAEEALITLDEADEILAVMVRHGFYSPVRKVSELE